MSGQQYDLSPEQLAIIKEKAQRRAVLREEFLKKSTNPFQHASGEGGTVFDPAIQRYNAMRVSTFEHFKPNMKTSRYGIGLIVIPMLLYGYLMKSQRDGDEDKFRRGEVAYKDRLFKLG